MGCFSLIASCQALIANKISAMCLWNSKGCWDDHFTRFFKWMFISAMRTPGFLISHAEQQQSRCASLMWPPTTHGLSLRYCSETPRTHRNRSSGARVSKHLLTLGKLKFCSTQYFWEKPYTRKPWQALTHILTSGKSVPPRVSKRLLTLAHTLIIYSCSGVGNWCLTFLFARSACSACSAFRTVSENDRFPANHGPSAQTLCFRDCEGTRVGGEQVRAATAEGSDGP